MSLLSKLKNSILAKSFYLTTALAVPAFAGCGDPEENNNTTQTYVTHSKGKTNSSGEVTLNGKTFQVKSESKKTPLADIIVHYFSKDGKNLVEAIDTNKKYSAGFQQFSGATSPNSLEGQIGTKNLALIDQIIWVKDVVKDIDEEVKKIDHGDFLGSDKNFNKYCMTMEQIKNTSVSVPLGLVFLAPKLAGADWKTLKNNLNNLLGSALEKYITLQFGVKDAYEVWVPKTAVSLCGQEYDDIVCSLTNDKLSKIWDPEKPIWMVKGSCDYKGSRKVCKGDELFCDDFDTWDQSKWEDSCNKPGCTINNGILEFKDIISAGILDSKQTFTIGNDTYVFEAMWKVDDQTGAYFGVGLVKSGEAIAFGIDSTIIGGNLIGTNGKTVKSNINPTTWHTTKFEANKNEINYYVDGNLVGKITDFIPYTNPLNVSGSCQSEDGKPHTCSWDYVKLTKK